MKLKRVGDHRLPPPFSATDGSAGFDLQAAEIAVLKPGETKLIATGFAWEIPRGYVGMVCPRSGLALKKGITVLNAPGIIDSDYRGEVKVILINLGTEDVVLGVEDRIAQLIIAPAIHGITMQEVDELSTTQRGEGGFGSTGE